MIQYFYEFTIYSNTKWLLQNDTKIQRYIKNKHLILIEMQYNENVNYSVHITLIYALILIYSHR